MRKLTLKIFTPAIIAAVALALTVGLGAQTSPTSGTPPDAKSPHMAPMAGHPVDSAAAVEHDADLKAECQAMMARKQEMQEKFQAMDAKLDGLVAEMNAARESRQADALEKPMAALLTELVAQRKEFRALQMEMQPAMMAHMMRHQHMSGMKGEMECPMMKKGGGLEPRAAGTKPMSMR